MTENTKKRLKGKPFVNSWTKVVECWAPSVGLDADEAVMVEKVLNPMGAEWGDLGNMKTRIYKFMTGESYGIFENKKREQHRKKQKNKTANFQRETFETKTKNRTK